jgi:hypothetical protein
MCTMLSNPRPLPGSVRTVYVPPVVVMLANQ